MKKILILTVFLNLFLVACTTGSNYVLKSFTHASFPMNLNNSMSADITNHLATVYPPGQTNFQLVSDNFLHPQLEQSLRLKGFSIANETALNPLKLAWTIDNLENSIWYLNVKLSDGYSFSKVYNISNNSLQDNGNLLQIKL